MAPGLAQVLIIYHRSVANFFVIKLIRQTLGSNVLIYILEVVFLFFRFDSALGEFKAVSQRRVFLLGCFISFAFFFLNIGMFEEALDYAYKEDADHVAYKHVVDSQ